MELASVTGTVEEELKIMPLVLKECKQKRWAVDGGANIGAFTEEMLKHFEAVIAVEPVAATCLQLCNKLGEHDNLIINGRALWHTAELTVHMTHPVKRTKSTAYYATMKEKNSEHPVKTTTIDDLVGASSVDFIKLDLEGAELNALMGGHNTIVECQPVILVECVQKQLDRYGHSIKQIDKWLAARRYQLRKESGVNRLYVPL
jgi:FkbM family methyltransferase